MLVIYKPVSTALKSAKVLPRNSLDVPDDGLTAVERRKKNLLFSLVVTFIGLAVAAICVTVFFVFLGAKPA